MWFDGSCPFHNDTHASFSIAVQATQGADGPSYPGHWICRAGCHGGAGDIVQLVAFTRGIEEKDAFKVLMDRFAPSGSPARKAMNRENKKEPAMLPTAEHLQEWQHALLGNQEALSHICGQRRISKVVLQSAVAGLAAGRIKFPVLDKQGKLLNVRTYSWLEEHTTNLERDPKMKGLFGRGTQAYPMHMVNWNAPIVITEGEIDALSFHTMGINGVTSTGGIGTLAMKFWGSHVRACRDVTIAVDNEPKSQRLARKFAGELVKVGVSKVRNVRWPKGIKDANEFLCKVDPSKWAEGWKAVLDSASIYTADRAVSFGLIEDGGCLYIEGQDEPVCMFTGKIVRTGRERDMDGRAQGVHTTIRLIHRDGDQITVEHDRMEGDFTKSVERASGGAGKWGFLRIRADNILKWIGMNDYDDTEEMDFGWLFGFDKGDEAPKFYTRSTIFTPWGAKKNGEVKMESPSVTLGKMDLPLPTEEGGAQGARAVFDGLLMSHSKLVTIPLIASAFLAPIRELRVPLEPVYSVFLYGGTGTGKTMAAWLTQNLFGDFRSHSDLANFNGTARSLESISAMAGHSLIVLDEFPVGAGQRERGALLRLLKGMQTSGRSRLKVDGSLLASPTMHGIPCVTSEALPLDDQAQLARSLMVPVEPVEKMEQRQAFAWIVDNRKNLPLAMSSWIDWAMREEREARWDQWLKAVRERVQGCFEAHYTAWERLTNVDRFYSRFCSMSATWCMVLEWGQAMGALDSSRATALWDEWGENVMFHLIETAFGKASEAGPAEHWVEAVESSIIAGKAKLRADDGATYPSYAGPNAPVVGLLKRHEDGVYLPGKDVRVRIEFNAQTASLLEGNLTWQTLIPYLTNEGYLEKTSRRREVDGLKTRTRVASRDLSAQILAQLLNPSGPLDS